MLNNSQKRRKLEPKNISDYKNGGTFTNLENLPKSRFACKRCRLKKVKCDQELPSCKNCSRVHETCISVDTATGEDIPRSYILFLEDRISSMIRKLSEQGIDPSTLDFRLPVSSEDPPYNVTDGITYSQDVILGSYLMRRGQILKGEFDNLPVVPTISTRNVASTTTDNKNESSNQSETTASTIIPETASAVRSMKQPFEYQESNKNISQVAPEESDASKSFLGDSSGISFAKLVFTAANVSPNILIKDSDNDIKKREKKLKEYQIAETTEIFDPIALPTRKEAEKLIIRYFVDTNAQLPMLHREFFLKKYFEPIYGPWNSNISLASDMTKINKEFKLPENAYFTPENQDGSPTENLTTPLYDIIKGFATEKEKESYKIPARFKIPLFFLNIIFAIGHTTQVLKANNMKVVTFKRRALSFSSETFASTDKLETLSATLLLTMYSLMRPNIPGVWFTMGSVLRLTVDLGLHDEKLNQSHSAFDKEMRRRLFWSVYSLDRQICSYFGRPFGIPEESITTRFPSMLDDSQIVATDPDVTDYSDIINYTSTSKVIALNMFKIRRIQASIVKVLYAPHAELPRQFQDIETWRSSVLEELDHWYHKEIPQSFESMNCKFNTFFFHLNYHYSKSILYGLSPKCPVLNEKAFQIVFKSTKGTIDVFHNLCVKKKLSYTWVAVHNMFMTGMAYLYVIYYYSGNYIFEDKKTVKQYTHKVLNVLKNLVGTCEAANKCYKTYKMLCAVVIKIKFSGSSIKDSYIPHPEYFGNDDIRRDGNITNSDNHIKGHSEILSNANNITNNEIQNMPQVAGTSISRNLSSYSRHNDGSQMTRLSPMEPELTDTSLEEFFSTLTKMQNNIDTMQSGGTHDTTFQTANAQQNQATSLLSGQEEMPSHAAGGMVNFTNPELLQTHPLPSAGGAAPFQDSAMTDLLFQVTSQPVWDELFGKIQPHPHLHPHPHPRPPEEEDPFRLF